MDECRESVFDIENAEVLVNSHNEEEELTCVCVVKNTSGIHVRPAGSIVKLFDGEECEASFTYAGKTVNAKSVMSILMLGAPQNGEIFVRIKGRDANRVLQKVRDAFDSGFGEL
ncbi:HPr family phosphocarrier protein [Chlamydia felis]|uniref:HPr family phosphocarrier protein n=1 Tax=Chlamydia felis TaxID=83556 RepID=UPI00059BF84A